MIFARPSDSWGEAHETPPQAALDTPRPAQNPEVAVAKTIAEVAVAAGFPGRVAQAFRWRDG